jgi:hypothetical protein
VTPPPGLIDRGIEIAANGTHSFVTSVAVVSTVPALTSAGMLVLVMLLIIAGWIVLRRRPRAQPG